MSLNSSTNWILMDQLCNWNGVWDEDSPESTFVYVGGYVEDENGEHQMSRTFKLKKSDGIFGDVDGDSDLDKDDWEAFMKVNQYWEMRDGGRFSNTALNIGRLILPGHSRVTKVTGPRLLNIWLYDSSDPAVADLGFNQLMSTIGKKRSVSYKNEIRNGKLFVRTTPGAAVLVYADFRDTTLFRSDTFADGNGEAVFNIKDTTLDYVVEICHIGQSTNIETGMVNKKQINLSFCNNKISFHLIKDERVDLKLFSLNGRMIVDLSSQRNSGKNIIDLNSLNIGKGMYFLTMKKKTIKINKTK